MSMPSSDAPECPAAPSSPPQCHSTRPLSRADVCGRPGYRMLALTLPAAVNTDLPQARILPATNICRSLHSEQSVN